MTSPGFQDGFGVAVHWKVVDFSGKTLADGRIPEEEIRWWMRLEDLAEYYESMRMLPD